jgi:RNA-binding protein PNO1
MRILYLFPLSQTTGSFSNIKYARDAICSLILGSPPGKVYSQLRYVSKRHAENF